MVSPGLISGVWPGGREFLERDAALALEADIDDGEFIVDADDAAGNDGPVEAGIGAEGLVEHCSKIFDPRVRREGCGGCHAFCLSRTAQKLWAVVLRPKRTRLAGSSGTAWSGADHPLGIGSGAG